MQGLLKDCENWPRPGLSATADGNNPQTLAVAVFASDSVDEKIETVEVEQKWRKIACASQGLGNFKHFSTHRHIET